VNSSVQADGVVAHATWLMISWCDRG